LRRRGLPVQLQQYGIERFGIPKSGGGGHETLMNIDARMASRAALICPAGSRWHGLSSLWESFELTCSTAGKPMPGVWPINQSGMRCERMKTGGKFVPASHAGKRVPRRKAPCHVGCGCRGKATCG
jgi:hypothetical protein